MPQHFTIVRPKISIIDFYWIGFYTFLRARGNPKYGWLLQIYDQKNLTQLGCILNLSSGSQLSD